MIHPIRLQLSRRKGFNLQEVSRAANGLEAVNVSRGPGRRWGNPFDFRKSDYCWAALSFGCKGDRLGRQEASVRAHRDWIEPGHGRRTFSSEFQPKLGNATESIPLGPKVTAGEAPSIDDIRKELRSKNLACWCKPGEPCHADVLLEIANR